MIFNFAAVLLGPVFYIQGKYVRRVTPKLPEPEGQREGLAGQGTPLSLLITGDSAAAGVGVDQQQQALSGQILNALPADYEVSWKLVAKSGDESAQLLSNLQEIPAAHFDVVVVSIGVNDVTSLVTAGKWENNLQTLIKLLQDKLGAQHILFSCLPPMHLFPALPQPLRWWLGLRAKQFNRLMRCIAEQHSSCTFVDINYPLDPDYAADDGYHPGAPAYALWGKQVAELIVKYEQQR